MGTDFMDIIDYFMIAILVVVIVAILIGKGTEVMSILNGNRSRDPGEAHIEPKAEQKGILIFSIILLIDILLMHFGGQYWTVINLIGIFVAIADIAWISWYLRQHRVP